MYAASAVGPLSDVVDGEEEEEEEVGRFGGAYGRRIVGSSYVCTNRVGMQDPS